MLVIGEINLKNMREYIYTELPASCISSLVKIAESLGYHFSVPDITNFYSFKIYSDELLALNNEALTQIYTEWRKQEGWNISSNKR